MSDIFTLLPAEADDPSNELTAATAHNTLAGRSVAGAHPATAVTYDNDTSGLTADTVQEALDELAASGGGGAVDSVNGETGVVVLDASDVDAVPVTAVGLLAGETNRGDWDIATAYAVGDVVHDHDGDGHVYVATVANTGEQPSAGLGSWAVLDWTSRQVALGPGSHANGVGAFAAGPGAGADGTFASAGGAFTSATGESAFAAGPGATATGTAAFAAGPGATATGTAAFAAGPTTTASGDGAFATGPTTTASGDGAVNIANLITGHITDPLGSPTPDGLTLATGFLDLPETAAVTNPAADHQRLIARTDGLYVRDEAGSEVGPLGAGGPGIVSQALAELDELADGYATVVDDSTTGLVKVHHAPLVFASKTTATSGTSSQTSLLSSTLTVPGSWTNGGNLFSLDLFGSLNNNTGGAANFTLSVWVGAAAVWTWTLTGLSASATDRPWQAQIAGSVAEVVPDTFAILIGPGAILVGSAGGGAVAASQLVLTGTSLFTPGASISLDVRVQHSTSSASQSSLLAAGSRLTLGVPG